jgi:hypothetical protein
MRLPTRQIVLEGCDLSGKSTLYGQLHKTTNFRYDIRDRGHVSRSVYPKIFGRDNSHESDELYRFLDDLNNVVVFLSPEWSTVTARFESRGDEMHNLGSLRRTWEEFNTQSLALRDHPSVITCKGIPDPEAIREVVHSREFVTTKKVAEYVERSLVSTGRNETLCSQFEIICSPADDPGPAALMVSGEEEYYQSIHDDLIGRIENEKASGQSPESRRFVAVNPSCISYIRFIHRDSQDLLDVVCRSTNVPKNLKIDLDALVHLAFKAQSKSGSDNRDIKMRVSLNCAHIIP